MSRQSPARRLLSLVVILALAMISAGVAVALQPAAPVGATHFRAAQLNYSSTGGTSVAFEVSDAFRRDGYGCYNSATLSGTPCSAPDGLPGVGDVIVEY